MTQRKEAKEKFYTPDDYAKIKNNLPKELQPKEKEFEEKEYDLNPPEIKQSPENKEPAQKEDTSPIKTNTPKKKKTYHPRTKLTFKQERFAQRYIKNNGNGTKTALEVYNPRNKRIAQAQASENLSKPMIINRITEILNGNKLDMTSSVKKLHALTEHNKAMILDKDIVYVPDGQVRLESLRTVLKLHGVLNDTNVSIDARTLNLGLSSVDLQGIGDICTVLKDMNNTLSMNEVQDGEIVSREAQDVSYTDT